MLKSRKFSS